MIKNLKLRDNKNRIVADVNFGNITAICGDLYSNKEFITQALLLYAAFPNEGFFDYIEQHTYPEALYFAQYNEFAGNFSIEIDGYKKIFNIEEFPHARIDHQPGRGKSKDDLKFPQTYYANNRPPYMSETGAVWRGVHNYPLINLYSDFMELSETDNRIREQLREEFHRIAPHMAFAVNVDDYNPDNPRYDVELVHQNKRKWDCCKRYDPVYAHILQILTGGIFAKPGDLFIVEKPETFLHPYLQAKIGEFLAKTTARGVQVVVETDNETIFNRSTRIPVKTNLLNPFDVSIQFVSKDMKQIVTLELGTMGGIVTRPNGFFDQVNKDLYDLC